MTEIDLDGRLLREEPDELAARLTAVINAALERARPRTENTPADPPPDMDAIRRALDSVLSEGLLGMSRVTGSLGEAVAQINQRATMRGSFEPPDIEGLLQWARAALDAAKETPARAHSEGRSPDGRVAATASSDGRVVTLDLVPRPDPHPAPRPASHPAPRLGTAEIAEGVRAAVNTALAEAEKSARRAAEPSPEFLASVREAQDTGLRLLDGYVASLRALMDSAQPK
ncbi:hypothetical protein [Actinomadura roseirufa]|uniref:hypothetical protein n=1 Tax=Actinomadura roseirufa TaxID=2094049 RepID=UPI001041BAFA|nr:hypothetical protein [Actinomadura roseirufa]